MDNFTAYLKAICFSLTLLCWVERALCFAKQQADKLDIEQMRSSGEQNALLFALPLCLFSYLIIRKGKHS